jgi:hypothetical protein
LPRNNDPTHEQFKALERILAAITGISDDDVVDGADQVAARFPENPAFIIPDDGTRP